MGTGPLPDGDMPKVEEELPRDYKPRPLTRPKPSKAARAAKVDRMKGQHPSAGPPAATASPSDGET